MELGIAIDGEGQLGRPAAVTAIAQAADRLGYGSVWCLGPWAATLVGAVAVVTSRVRIGVEAPATDGLEPIRAAAGDRLVVVVRLPLWSPGSYHRSGDTVRLYVSVGHEAGVRPKDLVGAIAGESPLSGSDIGSIQIADRFSLVEVPSARADEVVDSMKRTTIKGRKAKVRRERFER